MFKQVIIVRTDLGMDQGRAAAQIAHAAVSAVANNIKHPDVREWLKNHFTKVVLKVNSEDHLLALRDQAKKLNLITGLMEENNLPGFHYNIPTALAIGPAFGKRIDTVTGRLPKY